MSPVHKQPKPPYGPQHLNASRMAAWLGIWILAGVAVLLYLQLLGLPHARQQMGSTGLAPDNGVGLFPPWYATQQWLLHGRNPYSMEVAAETQQRVYGRAAEWESASLLRDEHRFAYPLHIALLLAPTVWLPFEVAQWVVLAILLAATISSIPWWLRGLSLSVGSSWRWILVMAVLGALPIQQGLYLQQLGLLVAALLSASLAAVASKRYLLAGLLLAAATVKPQLAAGLAGFLLLWAVGDLRHRRQLLAGFAIGVVALLGTSTVLMPNWFPSWIGVVRSYPAYTGARPWLQMFFGRVGMAIAAAALAFVLYRWWQARRLDPATPMFGRVVLLTLAVQMLVVPTWIGHNLVLLVPVAAAAAVHPRRIWSGAAWCKLVLLLAVIAVVWERASAAVLAVLAAVDAAPRASQIVALPVYPLMLLPLLGLLLVLAYTQTSEAQVQAATK